MAITQQEELDIRDLLESGVWGDQLKTYVGAAATFALTTHGERVGRPGRTPYLQLVDDGVRAINYDNGQPRFRVEFECHRHVLKVRLTAGEHTESWSTDMVRRQTTYDLVRCGIHWVESYLLPAIWDCLDKWSFGVAHSEFVAGGDAPWLSIPDVIEVLDENVSPLDMGYCDEGCWATLKGKRIRVHRKVARHNSGSPYRGLAVSTSSWNPFRPIVTSVIPLEDGWLPPGETNRLLSHELVELY